RRQMNRDMNASREVIADTAGRRCLRLTYRTRDSPAHSVPGVTERSAVISPLRDKVVKTVLGAAVMCSPLVFGDDTDDAQDQPPEPAHGAARPASFGTTDFTAVGASALATVSADRPIGAAGTQLASAAAVPVQDDALRTRRPPAVTGADDRPIGKAPEIVLSNDLEARVTALRGGATGAMRQAYRPKFVAPTHGTLTSGFGPRWGTMHRGIDIANALGTPIVSVADGTVIEAGPASGFGLWVRIRHD